MAINDELDAIINDPRLTNEDWKSLADVLKIESILQKSKSERREIINQEIRHNYGHTVVNIFRNAFEPDYVDPIVRDAAKKLDITVTSHRIEEIEDKILIKVIEKAKEQIIKEKGQAAWRKIEEEVEIEIKRLIEAGDLPPGLADQLKQLRGIALVATLIGGKMAGFALYIVTNQVFFAIARSLGLRVGVAIAGPIIGGALSFLLGPAGFLIAGLSLVYDLGNTNWGKVIPAVVIIATIRKRLQYEI